MSETKYEFDEQVEKDTHAISMLAIHGWENQVAQSRFLGVLVAMRETIERQEQRIRELEQWIDRREDYESEQRERR